MISETALVSIIRKLASAQAPDSSLIRGIGDDCAILRPTPGHDLVFTTDFLLEDRHFRMATHKPADIGHKALARSLSDVAAMGARPIFCLVSLAMPPSLGEPFVRGFYKGLVNLGAQHKVTLAGGDLAKSDKVVVDVMCCGEVETGRALLRGAARLGDAIYVSGRLGASAHGFRTEKGANFRRHLRPEPRVLLGQALAGLGVTCCMDLSDGLLLDLSRLCQESGVSATLTGELPIARGATREDVLAGGEDYELLFTAPEGVLVPSSIDGISISRVGTILAKGEQVLTLNGHPVVAAGFDHFRTNGDSPVS